MSLNKKNNSPHKTRSKFSHVRFVFKKRVFKKCGLEKTSLEKRSLEKAAHFRFEHRQLLASMLICGLLMPLFSLPASAALNHRSRQSNEKFEPVNERLSLWTKLFRSIDAEFEALETAYRTENVRYAESETNDKTSDKTNDKTKGDKNIREENRPPAGVSSASAADSAETDKKSAAASASKILTVPEKQKSAGPAAAPEKPLAEAAPNSSIAEPSAVSAIISADIVRPAITVSPMLVDLPENERESVYRYGNNLGSPPGQTEADSANDAAVGEIRHRVGIANFSFDVPLAFLAGRGVDVESSITYNSRTWNKSCITQNPDGGACAQNRFKYDVEQSWIAPGFTAGFGYLETSARSLSQGAFSVTPVGIVDADGTRHRLSCHSSPGSNCEAYLTNDGTFIKTDGQKIVSQGASAVFTAIYPNGTRITYLNPVPGGNSKYYASTVQDSNGNGINISYKADQSGRIEKIVDTLGRQVKFYYEADAAGSFGKLITVTVPGLTENSENQVARFYYEEMPLNADGKFVGTINAPAAIKVLRYVYQPATKTGYRYDYHPNFGMIRKISRIVGMQADSASTASTGSIDPFSGIVAASTAYEFPDGSTALTDVPRYTKRTDDWHGRTGAAQETLYHAPEPLPNQNFISQITVKDNNFDVVTENISAPDGMLRETSVTKRSGPEDTSTGERPYAQLITKNINFWAQRNLIKTETTNDAGLTQAIEYAYDQYNNQTSARTYDYAPPGNLGALLRTTEITYETGDGWINANLLGLIKSVRTIVGGVTTSKTVLDYDYGGNDYSLVRRPDIGGSHDMRYNPDAPVSCRLQCLNRPFSRPCSGDDVPDGCERIETSRYDPQASNYRGNVTTITSFADASLETDPNANVKKMNYDIAGNLVSETLSCCSIKTIAYDKANEYAFPISVTKGSSPQLTATTTYNRNTGLPLTETDENGQVTGYEYETDTLRPKKVTFPNGGYVITEHSDKLVTNPNDLLPGFARTTVSLEANKTVRNYSYFDGRGLVVRNASETTDGWSITAFENDKLGRSYKSYNPFYGATPVAPVPGTVKYSEISAFDALGRTTAVRLQDDTTVTTEYGDAAATPAGFNRTFLTVTDQAGKKRRQIFDALGRVVRVDEPNASGDLGSLTAPAQPTVYEYDGNDNLTKSVQTDGAAVQERRFRFDALSRLTHERQSEAAPTLDDAGVKGQPEPHKWTKFLKYNADSLLEKSVDARGVETSFVYDGLNRITGVVYSDGTPKVKYTYDQMRGGHFNNGALTRVETEPNQNAPAETPAVAAEYDYDLMGRTVKHRQAIGSHSYNLEYSYNLAGHLTSEKYPSGKIVSVNYDAKGRLANVADQSRAYLTGMHYGLHGGIVSSMTFGNGTAQTFASNDRLQTSGQTLSRGAEVLQKYEYAYGQIDAAGNLDAAKNNGQLARIESHIGTAKQWTQKFSYDSLGRLDKAEELRGDTNALSYRQKFDYDRFGNLYRKSASNPVGGQQSPLAFTPIEDADIDRRTNRLTSNTAYDEAGNVITDNKFRSTAFFYDANGRMIKAARENVPDAKSIYDAGGLRVAEKVNDAWRFLVYDIGGKLVAEYSGAPATGEGGVKYAFADWQGSTRAVTNSAGFVRARTDYQAFGEEISAGVGVRNSSQGFGTANNLRQKYGLTERDEATGLDHTWFRKNENKAGRWTSPDPYNGSIDIANPQTLNRYSYVENQPTNFIDPSGLKAEPDYYFPVRGRPWDVGDFLRFIIRGGGIGIGIGRGRGRGAGSQPQDDNCGVNPVTGRPGFNSVNDGKPGNLRPGVGGRGHFGARRTSDRVNGHRGLDVSGVKNQSPVYANRSGEVTFAGKKGINGNLVKIDHGGGVTTAYGHLYTTLVKEGERVEMGQQIGVVGQTGNAKNLPASEAHVHKQVTINGKIVDPAKYLNSPCPKK